MALLRPGNTEHIETQLTMPRFSFRQKERDANPPVWRLAPLQKSKERGIAPPSLRGSVFRLSVLI